MRAHRLPLGIDIGSTGLRIAEMTYPGPTLRNVVTAVVHPQASETHISTSLRDLVAQLHTKERRCVVTLDDKDAMVRELALPAMSRMERLRAARIETERFTPADMTYHVRVIRTSSSAFAVGAATKSATDRLLRITREARLRLIAIDHAGYALSRVFPDVDAVIDIGLQRTRFYTCRSVVPFSQVLDIGGTDFTQAVARSFSIDEESAEGRKRLHGIAPAGESEIAAVVHFIGKAIRAARAAGVSDIERMLLTGNGARLPLLSHRLERDTGCLVEIATRLPGSELSFASDIVRAAAPEWALACGTALWSAAAETAA